MKAEGRDTALLWDMLGAAGKAAALAERLTLEAYLADGIAQLAVERAIEIIGEAARGVSASFQSAQPEIPWRKIIGQRHVIAHDYGEIDHGRLWLVATVDVPKLIAPLRPLLPPGQD